MIGGVEARSGGGEVEWRRGGAEERWGGEELARVGQGLCVMDDPKEVLDNEYKMACRCGGSHWVAKRPFSNVIWCRKER